jgi:WD40 repeat protein
MDSGTAEIKLIEELPGKISSAMHTWSSPEYSQGHTDRAWAVAWNPEKPLLASCSTDKSVRLYNFRLSGDTSIVKFTLNTAIDTGHAKTVRALAWSPSGNTLATGSFDSNVAIWQQTNENEADGEWECASTLEGH